MLVQPGSAILKHFGIEVVAPFGGIRNQHWLVEAHRQQLVLRRWSVAATAADIDYEARLLTQIAARGWPVAPLLAGPLEHDGYFWSIAAFLPGEPPSAADPLMEQRERGRLLAALHADLAHLQGFGQRGSWRRCEQILSDPTVDQLLADCQAQQPEQIRILQWHLARARQRIAGLAPHSWPGIIIHGDFAPWNLRFIHGHLSGILDFELAHWDHRIGDFALSWRGKYDQVIYGYNDEAPLTPAEWELITPLWWAHLIDGACQDLRAGISDDGWTIRKLLQRSPLMGPDAGEFR